MDICPSPWEGSRGERGHVLCPSVLVGSAGRPVTLIVSYWKKYKRRAVADYQSRAVASGSHDCHLKQRDCWSEEPSWASWNAGSLFQGRWVKEWLEGGLGSRSTSRVLEPYLDELHFNSILQFYWSYFKCSKVTHG